MSSPDQPSSPPQGEPSKKDERLMTTLSAHGSTRLADLAREEIKQAVAEGKPPQSPTTLVREEVTEAAVKFTDGVDVITETLILILGKFNQIIWRTTVGMSFGAAVLVTCVVVAWRTNRTALEQEASARKIVELTGKFEEALRRLDKIQQSANSTEQTVNEVKATADAKPSIEIVPDKARPGSAKVVIRSAPSQVTTPPASTPPVSAASQPTGRLGGGARKDKSFDSALPEKRMIDQDIVEIPIQLPARDTRESR